MLGYGLYSQEAEEAAVGALFLEDGLIKDCKLRPEHFYLSRLKRLMTIILQLDAKGKPVDVISVVEEAGHHNLESIGGIGYITEIAGSVPTAANFTFYQDTVFEYYQKRKAVEIAGRIQESAQTGDISCTLRDGIQDLMQIEDLVGDDDLGDVVPSLVELYGEAEKDLGEMTGIPSGFRSLDKLTGGFQESDLIIVGARPSVGKTAFALNMAMNAADQNTALIFSLEMSKKQLLKRMISCKGEISSIKLRNPKRYFGEGDWTQFSSVMGSFGEVNLHIFDRAGMNIGYIWSKVRKARREYGEGKRMLVVIDYLQLISGDPGHQNRQAEISEISRKLKTMARELNVAVIALSQLSRGVESRQDKRPMLSDLRESGQIEQDADLIAFLYRDDYYDKDSDRKDTIEIILAKQRNGPIGTVRLAFMKEIGKFGELQQGS
ncbi:MULTISPECIES: replicative DNA helicase [unclassified Cytobacillus]|uniref:replicative DNA helicase n=1 Tax=unclassified Cytobacillus TaxID=2675268 RepID=UPI0013575CB4|nr:replicative DNA helicase [Cytobacillus sp. AMY 15.2]KAF0820871.1 Replicative DNA helicase (DnaB) [Bacillus sp. ZZV12-4809]MCM3090853.1 replicative DNA helicase [Cytobacillus sp. AMY 15.2]